VATTRSLVKLLQRRALEDPDRPAYTFLDDGENESERLTYGQMDCRARATAALLQSLGMSGRRVALVLPSGLDYLIALFGCMYAGALAVPAFPPRVGLGVPDRTTSRLRAICADARPGAILTNAAVLSKLDQVVARAPELGAVHWLSMAQIDPALAENWEERDPDSGDVAYLQYTSGSTSTPRGIILTHGNLLYEAAALSELHRYTPDSASFVWLPLFHDWGLVEGILQPLFQNIHCHLMSPEAMVQQPVRWLRGISRYRCTHSISPNFALELCLRKITPEQRESLDLSSWCAFPNAAEPIRRHTLERFAAAFAPCGFRPEAYIASYGLAEATLVICSRRHSCVTFCSLSSTALGQGHVVEAASGEPKVSVLASCGTPVAGTRIEIVDPETYVRCPPGQVGEIWAMGPSVGRGYWNSPEATAATFHAYLKDTGEGPFFRSGDFGFVRYGEIHVAGRLKDLLIINGENHYPQDIENTVEQCAPMLRAGCGAVFSIDDGNEERLVIVYEARPGIGLDPTSVVRMIRTAVSERHDLEVYAISFIAPGTIAKTSSGKIQRGECRKAFLADALETVAQWRMPASGGEVSVRGPSDGSHRPLDRAAIETWLIGWLAQELDASPAELDTGMQFSALGMSSRQALSLSGALGNWLGKKVSPTAVYVHTTIDALARHLADAPARARPKPAVPRNVPLESEPIAIIGAACRFPGADSPEALWKALLSGFDAISEVPTTRWDNDAFYHSDPNVPGKIYTRHGGFIRDIDKFDAGLFGISGREAIGLDPQQRLVLEVSWEALERAGQDLDCRSRNRTGVFLGIGHSDYAHMRMRDPTEIDAYTATGNAASVAAGRLSYLLGLDGPSVAVDTACSSSLMAIHLACQSLRTGECNRALAGGVNAILSPFLAIGLCKAGMLSPEGRCKTFAAEADGYVRSEGCGVAVLKLLRDALADRDMILALVRGSAVNQDGRSNGLTAPNGRAQEAVIRAALEGAGVAPLQLSYVEAHGTGTPVGDPIEINAIAAALGEGRGKENALIVGSVKSNIGHLEAASGIAGLMKTLMAIERECIPPNLHFRTPSPHLAWDDLPISVPTQPIPWPRGEAPRLAGVSSFGFSGTNVHLVIEEPPPPVPQADEEPRHHLLRLSAATMTALHALARRFEQHLAEHPSLPLADVCFTAGLSRARLPHRLAVAASSCTEMRRHLAGFASGDAGAAHVGHVIGARETGVVFLFTGQGSHYAGMAHRLYETQPTFRRVLDSCDALLRSRISDVYGRTSLLTALQSEPGRSCALEATIYSQPALFAVEVALAEVWRSWGVEPVAAMGHSLGEYAAACVAGALTYEDGLLLVAERARLMHALPRRGAMAAVFADEASVAAALAPHRFEVAIAAVNGPRNVVISGDAAIIDDLLAWFDRAGLETRRLNVSNAFHSPLMDPVLDGLEQAAEQVTWRKPRITLVSNLTGTSAEGPPAARYWSRHAREPVRFADGMQTLARLGWRVFLELGPSAVLAHIGADCIDAPDAAFIPSLKQGEDDWRMLLNAAAALSVRGVELDTAAIAEPLRPRRVLLPTYPFERQRYWGVAEISKPARETVATDPAAAEAAHATASPEAVTAEREPSPAAGRAGAAAAILARPTERRRGLVANVLRAHVAEMLMIDPDLIGSGECLTRFGLDSIMALKLRNRVQTDFGLEVPMLKFFDRASIDSITDFIIQSITPQATHSDAVRPVIRVNQTLPLSASQRALWLLHQTTANEAAYSTPTAFRLRGELDVSVLERCLSELLRRHASLRTTFQLIEDEPRQLIASARPAFLPVIDLRGLNDVDAQTEAQRLMIEEAKRPFDLRRGPGIRVTLLQVGATEWILLLTLHHMVADGWSILGILVPELVAVYRALAEGKPSPLHPPRLQYADFAVWQQSQHTADAIASQLDFWRATLSGASFSLPLPADRPRPAVARNRGGRLTCTLPGELTDRLNVLSRERGVTLFVVLLAAMKILLYRLTGQRDIVVGTTMTTRTRPELEAVVGDFTNHLPLRSQLSANLSAAEFIARIERVVIEAFAHGLCPFDKIVEAVNPARKGGRHPLYDVAFVMHTFAARPFGPWSAGPFELSLVSPLAQVDNGTSELDMIFELAETAHGLVVECEYDSDLFERATIDRLIAGYQTILTSVAADPAQRISDLPVLSRRDRHLLLSEWNRPTTTFQAQSCVHQLFEATVRRHRDSVALRFGEKHLSYDELNRQANRLAHRLHQLGVRPGRVVGILMEPCIEFVVAILATLKAGGAYLPIDPRYPADRVAFMLKDSAASLLLAMSLPAGLPPCSGDVLLVMPDFVAVAGEPETDLDSGAAPDDLAYVIYTSGSTGTPKGVLVPHANIVRLFRATQAWFAFDARDVWTLFHSFSFDFSVWEMWGALLYGGRLVIVPFHISRAPEAFYHLLCIEGVTVLNQTPTAFRQLAASERTAGAEGRPVLRLIIFGGERLDLSVIESGLAQYPWPRPRVINMYGITETTVHVTYREFDMRVPEPNCGSSIGVPIPDMHVYILDRHHDLVPIGALGELCIGGAGVARGYLNQPSLTAEQFIPDPFSPTAGARLYRSGDLGRYRHDGSIDFLGRMDQQVKIRGFRIELGEIEVALKHHPSVSEAVVALEEAEASDRLVAYVVPARAGDGSNAGNGEDADFEAAQLSYWHTVFDETYRGAAPIEEPSFNIAGWKSSYTGEMIPTQEMKEWVDGTIAQILERRPQQVLEIGCGMGLLLFRVAPFCTRYVGTDFSAVALEYVQRQFREFAIDTHRIELLERAADNFDDIAAKSFDLVILNSVSQLLPSIDYLSRVLEGAVESVKAGGAVFVGDVRSLPLLDVFHTSVQMYGAMPTTPLPHIKLSALRRKEREEELVIDPGFFFALKRRLPRLGRVEVRLKRGRCHNELTRFRYDVLLHVTDELEPIVNVEPHALADWSQEGLTIPALEDRMRTSRPPLLVVRCVPNARLVAEVAAARLVLGGGGGTKADLAEMLRSPQAVEPEDLFDLGARVGYVASVTWSGTGAEGLIDVLFQRHDSDVPAIAALGLLEADPASRSHGEFANAPMRRFASRRLSAALRSHLARTLPEHMVPSSIVIQQNLPLTVNGKIDRRALPNAEYERPEIGEAFVPPDNPIENILASIFGEVLDIDRVGVNDNFFELGGHSLLATQVVSRIRAAFRVEMPLRVFFEGPNVGQLAAFILSDLATKVDDRALAAIEAMSSTRESHKGRAGRP
jgi:amino acid adenylation domain-containing protein